MKHFWSALRLGLFCLAVAACGAGDEPAAAPNPPTAPITPSPRPTVVSLSPQATRFVLALGAADQLIAVDAVSARLSGLSGLPQPAWEDLPDFAPDLVLVSEPIAPGDPVADALADGRDRQTHT